MSKDMNKDMSKTTVVQAWRIWADEYGYGEDAYLMTEDDLRDMAQQQVDHLREEGMDDLAFYDITPEMAGWACNEYDKSRHDR